MVPSAGNSTVEEEGAGTHIRTHTHTHTHTTVSEICYGFGFVVGGNNFLLGPAHID